ncbi:MAG: chemotaxis protein CheW [Burkholderiaceae bacterium]|jgi:twitching motility protein PilI|nr:chemotaxis protein CheW [Burkholderiaceae bacterium]
MSNPQTLREFQAHLAQRLQSARTKGVTAAWLAVEAGPSRLLLPLNHAGEIFPWTQVQKVPYVRSWFMGVANLRGGLYGVVDLASFLQHGGGGRRPESESGQSHLVTFNPLLDAHCAVLVDRLLGLRGSEAFASSAAAGEGAPAYFGHAYTDLQGGQWQELNLQLLSRHPAFLGIAQ